MNTVLNKTNQIAALKIIQDYGIVSPIIIAKNIKIKQEQAGKLIDFLFIQGFIKTTTKSESNNIDFLKCGMGCEGCPFRSISACSGFSSKTQFYLTKKAKILLKPKK
ncbi:MAG: hypothetical protein ACTSX0_13095 [Promethearchaeota archaeon]